MDRAAGRQPDFLSSCDEDRARSADRGPDGGPFSAARDAADDGAGARPERALLDVVLRAGLSLSCDACGLDPVALAGHSEAIEDEGDQRAALHAS